MDGFKLENNDGVVTLTLALPGGINVIGAPFIQALGQGLDAALATEGVRGVIVASGHRDFCAGADLSTLYPERDPAQVLEAVRVLNGLFRRMETSGVPLVAAVTGAALGGGYELALACHHIAALDDPRIQVGLPELNLGVIPGAGGTQRLPWRVGLQKSLEAMAAGKLLRAPKAVKAGWIDAVYPTREALMQGAHDWIVANPTATQPWDTKGSALPGGVQPGTEAARNLLIGASAFLYKRTAGAYPAANELVRVVSEGTRCALAGAFDRGLEIESRAFAALATSDQAKDMIRSLFYLRTAAEKQAGLPRCKDPAISKVAVLGAGMMGGGLGFLCAKAGFETVVRDIHQPALDAAVAHCTAQVAKLRHLSQDDRDALLSRLSFTLDVNDVAGADLVIEAVVENTAIKHAVIREIEPLLAPNAIFASNTSALPIASLAAASVAPDRFIGMHFFSPVEKMPLLEVIQPPDCSDDTLARTLAVGRALKKTCIVVNDGYGFFTSRLFAAYLLEGCTLVAEGHDPRLVEWAARTLGMAMPPLKVFDEVTLTLGAHAFRNQEEVLGRSMDLPGVHLVEKLIELGRPGRSGGKGFYDWDTKTLWSGIGDLTADTPAVTGLAHLQRRLMIAQAAEVSRILDDGIIRDPKDVEVGAILGLGFAPNTGGPLAWMDRQGLPALVEEMQGLAAEYGDRYAPAPGLVARADAGESFWGAWSA
jgi:3-hydroxyacyl-CoA dehydrogenase/enoyl-CoA hydratase/3-hydroxybutyryl-CoA epimerase